MTGGRHRAGSRELPEALSVSATRAPAQVSGARLRTYSGAAQSHWWEEFRWAGTPVGPPAGAPPVVTLALGPPPLLDRGGTS